MVQIHGISAVPVLRFSELIQRTPGRGVFLVVCTHLLWGLTMLGQGRPSLQPLRFEEDWSYLADPSRRIDALDRLKFIRLRKSKDWSLTLGGEVRPWGEYYRNELWGDGATDNAYFLQRFMMHADIRLGENARFFGQLKSAIEEGRKGGPRGADEDHFDIHQAFWEFRIKKSKGQYIRLGRQEIALGSQRLISVREGPNARQSFDGIHVRIPRLQWSFDFMVLKPARTRVGIFDDSPDPSRTLWIAHASGPKSLLSAAGRIDAYYIGLDRKLSRFDSGSAREQRHTAGVRIFNKDEPLDYNFEVIGQWGSFGAATIRAWTVASETGYTIRQMNFQPRFSLRADVTSGDRSPTDGQLNTFNPLFPRGAYFGQLTALGPQNHMDLHPGVEFHWSERFTTYCNVAFFWRQSTQDGLYGIAGNLIRPRGNGEDRFIGYQPGVEFRYRANQYTTIALDLATFQAGSYLKANPPSRTTLFSALWVTFRF
jgi:hypothetical protein